MRSCIHVLHQYVTELRSYMKKFPWPAGGDTSSPTAAVEESGQDEWACLPTEVT